MSKTILPECSQRESRNGNQEAVSGGKSPNKSNCKNLSPREALNSEVSRCKAEENFQFKPPTFATCLESYHLLSVMGGPAEGSGIYKWGSHGKDGKGQSCVCGKMNMNIRYGMDRRHWS